MLTWGDRKLTSGGLTEQAHFKALLGRVPFPYLPPLKYPAIIILSHIPYFHEWYHYPHSHLETAETISTSPLFSLTPTKELHLQIRPQQSLLKFTPSRCIISLTWTMVSSPTWSSGFLFYLFAGLSTVTISKRQSWPRLCSA